MTRQNPPAVVEVTRGDQVESTHLVDAVISDAKGAIVRSWGEHDRMIYPRSAVKALQALPLIESGAADAFGLEKRHLALACSSHNGEEIHTTGATQMLERAGIGPQCLECGEHHPELPKDIAALAINRQEVSQLHNNCSGKHSGFLAVARQMGFETGGYVAADHPVQRLVAATLEETIRFPILNQPYGIDGCSIPTYRIPLDKLAAAFARFGLGEANGEMRRQAMLRLQEACFTHPEMVAGTGRVCTNIMQVLKGRAFVKVGAEGVYTAALPEKGLGIALKARDGTRRAAETAIGALISLQLTMNEEEHEKMQAIANPELRNRRNIATGSIKLVR